MAEHAHGPVVGLVDDLPEPSCHTGFDDRAFGQAAADDAVAVLVAAPPPGTVGVGDVIPARPRARLQTLRPVRPSGLALVGREPHVAPALPADAGRAASRQTGHLPDARAVADLDLDDLRSSSDRCEYTFPIGATSLRTGYLDNLQSNGCCTFN